MPAPWPSSMVLGPKTKPSGDFLLPPPVAGDDAESSDASNEADKDVADAMAAEANKMSREKLKIIINVSELVRQKIKLSELIRLTTL